MDIISEVFDHNQADYIETLIKSPVCEWAYLHDSSGTIHSGRTFPSFSKPIYHESKGSLDHQLFHRLEMASVLIAAKAQCKYNELARIRLGMHLPDPSWDGHHGVHVDQQSPHTVVIYYVNDSDGDTYLFDSDRQTVIHKVSPKKNTMLVFDGNIPHASSYPSFGQRLVINYNFNR